VPYLRFYSPDYYWPEGFYGYAPDYYYGPDEAWVSTHPAQPYSSAVSPDPLSLGFQRFSQGQYLLAKRLFAQALTARPKDASVYFAYAQALFALGEYRLATDAVRHGLALDPTWPQATADVRSLYADPSEFTSQLARLEAYVASHPDDTDARFLLAYNLYFSGQEAQAAQEFSRLAQANPLDRGPELFLQQLQQPSGEAGAGSGQLPGAMTPNSGAPAY
jgi:Flp pilus assembly protein TadD